MSDFYKKVLSDMEHSNAVFKQGEIHGALTVINRLFKECIEHKYTDISQLMGAIHTIADELKPMTPEQYEKEAKATNQTTSEFF